MESTNKFMHIMYMYTNDLCNKCKNEFSLDYYMHYLHEDYQLLLSIGVGVIL